MKIELSIEDISEELYTAICAAFREKVEKQGLIPDDFFYDNWVITGDAVAWTDEERNKQEKQT